MEPKQCPAALTCDLSRFRTEAAFVKMQGPVAGVNAQILHGVARNECVYSRVACQAFEGTPYRTSFT